jgi:integration host factor subunit beta
MTKSELIALLATKQTYLEGQDVGLAVNAMVRHMSDALAAGERVDIRGFGSFTLHSRRPRIGRNPKTGEPVTLIGRYVPHFKPGKEMRERVNGTTSA